MTREQEFTELATDQMAKVGMVIFLQPHMTTFMVAQSLASWVNNHTGESELAFLESLSEIFKKASLSDHINPFKQIDLLGEALRREQQNQRS